MISLPPPPFHSCVFWWENIHNFSRGFYEEKIKEDEVDFSFLFYVIHTRVKIHTTPFHAWYTSLVYFFYNSFIFEEKFRPRKPNMFVNYKGTSLIQLFVLQTIISWKIFVWKRKGDTKSINFEALSSSRSHPGGKRTRIKTLEPRQGSPTSHGVWENPIDAFRSLENENLTSNPLGWTKDGYRVPSIIPDKRWKARERARSSTLVPLITLA